MSCTEAVRTAVINKRAGGMGLISGRKAFQKPIKEGFELLNASRTRTWIQRDSGRPGAERARAGESLWRGHARP